MRNAHTISARMLKVINAGETVLRRICAILSVQILLFSAVQAANVPVNVHGFNGTLEGEIESVATNKRSFVIAVTKATPAANSTCADPKSIIGKLVEIDTIQGTSLETHVNWISNFSYRDSVSLTVYFHPRNNGSLYMISSKVIKKTDKKFPATVETPVSGKSPLLPAVQPPQSVKPVEPAKFTPCSAEAKVFNVRTFGAKGDGSNDDTAAVQAAIQQAAQFGGEVYLPRGTYRIIKTLLVDRQRGLVLAGENGSPWSHGGHSHQPKMNTSTLVWDGEAGGVLMQVVASPQLRLHDLNFAGSLVLADKRRAGVLLKINSINGPGGGGSMLYKFDNTHFYCAEVGLQLGDSAGEHCNSDMIFTYTTFRELETAFLVKNHQGVDFLFDYVFGLAVGTMFHFECGGNLMVNNAQFTGIRVVLRIDHGGGNAGTYLCNNVRIEGEGGVNDRFQALVSKPKSIANVKFSGFDDVQYNWKNNKTDKRTLPLFDIGAGTVLTLENSILQGPTVSVSGDTSRAALAIVRECIFTTLSPADSVSANDTGYFRMENNIFGGKPARNVYKQPEMEDERITNATHTGAGFR